MLQWGMRQEAEVENQMTSVERVLEYSHLPAEPPMESQPGKTELWMHFVDEIHALIVLFKHTQFYNHR